VSAAKAEGTGYSLRHVGRGFRPVGGGGPCDMLALVVQRNTLETSPATTVLVVGGPSTLVEAARMAARGVPTAEVRECELRDAATRVAELWPFAIVMSEDLYGFDCAEFDALARDVSARLITVTTESTAPAHLAAQLGNKIVEAFRLR